MTTNKFVFITFVISYIVILNNQSLLCQNKQFNFDILNGNWKGNLEYLDYTSNKLTQIPSELKVKKILYNTFEFLTIYNEEPNANSTDTLIVDFNSKLINNQTIIQQKLIDTNVFEIITQSEGKDGNENKPAIFKFTYFLSKNKFVKMKEVKYFDSNLWLLRHKYTYNKK